MSEWLTTGEMIDRLKVGEVYELANPNSLWDCLHEIQRQVTIWKNGHVKYKDGTDFTITKFIKHEAKWRKIPKYVTFEEAMKALKDGETVKLIYKDGSFDRLFNAHEYVDLGHSTWEDIFEGKWQIIE